MEKSTINAILNAQADINENPMTNILDSVANTQELDDIRSIIKKAYHGDTKISNGKYYYSEEGLKQVH